jgi:type 1 glutamine amidotransferase
MRVLGVAFALMLIPTLQPEPTFRVLLFSRTVAFRHDSIPDAVDALSRAGPEHGFAVDATEDPTTFSDERLAGYAAVAFVMTTGDVLDTDQQAAFERYIQSGGGYVGVHSASDTEYDWPWYGGLVGTYFADHPPGLHDAVVHIEHAEHPSTIGLPAPWPRTDEWYNFRSNPRDTPEIQVLASLDESTYSGGSMGDHPIAWFHAYDGGRAWYTAGGHTKASYYEPLFVQHLVGGILYAAGQSNY